MLFVYFLYSLLATLVAATPLVEGGGAVNITVPHGLDKSVPDLATSQGWDPSFYHHDYSTIQVWMDNKKTQVGTLVTSKLYEKIMELLEKECPKNNAGGTCKKNTNAEAPSTCINRKGKHVGCQFIISVISAEWANDNICQQLMKAVAGALNAATLLDITTSGGNCWDIGDGKKACNVGDVVRVNFPKSVNGKDNYFHIGVKNWFTGWGSYQCCGEGIRAYMDMMLDNLKYAVTSEFPNEGSNPWFRDSRCIINGWQSCPAGASDN